VILGTLLGVVGSAWSLSYHAAPGETSVGKPATQAATSAAPASKTSHVSGSRSGSGSADTDTGLAAQRTTLGVDEAMQKLRTMLSDRMLTEVTVERTPQGLVLHGNLQNESRLVFQRMLQRFDDRYQSDVAIVDEVSVGGSSLPFAIVQIMSGPQAHLVTADGKRLYIGDEINGLRLTRIDDGHVEFEGDRHYEVSW
jgi:type III secretion protein D